MSRGGSGAGKTATAKRVPPPAVPGDAFGTPQHRHSGSSFGSQGYASCEEQQYPQPPDTPSHTRGKKLLSSRKVLGIMLTRYYERCPWNRYYIKYYYCISSKILTSFLRDSLS